MQAWRDNKTLRFAVGVTLTVLLIRWLLTGDLLFAVRSVAEQPAEGETKSVALVSALWPIFFEAMVIVGTAALAWAFKLWDLLYGLVNSASEKPAAVAAAGTSNTAAVAADGTDTAVQPTVTQQPMSVDSLVQGLARAAATNDTAAMNKLKVQIRKPYALDELNQAYNDGDVQRVEKLTKELTGMITKGLPS